MAGLVSSLTTAFDLCKRVREIAGKLSNAELKNTVGDLTLSLAELKIELAALQEENLKLKQQIRQGSEMTVLRSQLKLKDGAYHFQEVPADRPVGPYCTRCFDVDQKLVLLSELPSTFQAIARYRCNNCKGHA